MIIKQLFLLLLGVIGTVGVLAQQQLPAGQNIYDDGSKGVVYDRELTFGVDFITPRSLAFGVKLGQLKSYYQTRYWSIDIGDLRHSREARQSFEALPLPTTNRVSRAFVYGKQNNFYTLRGGLGQRRYLSEKAQQKGVAVGYTYEFGPTLGLLKPYYLELRRNTPGEPSPTVLREERYSPENEDIFLDDTRIFGAARWSLGLSELSLMPGIHGRFATHFGLGAFDQFAKSLEVGVMADFFFRDVPIMIESSNNPGVRNSPLFLNLYLSLHLGKRW